MIVKLLNEHHLEFLSLKGGCRGSSESTLVKISNCWKYHATAHLEFKKYENMSIYLLNDYLATFYMHGIELSAQFTQCRYTFTMC